MSEPSFYKRPAAVSPGDVMRAYIKAVHQMTVNLATHSCEAMAGAMFPLGSASGYRVFVRVERYRDKPTAMEKMAQAVPVNGGTPSV